jgi:hypothetical protein
LLFRSRRGSEMNLRDDGDEYICIRGQEASPESVLAYG